MDLGFWKQQHRQGDYVLVHVNRDEFYTQYFDINRLWLAPVAVLRGENVTASICRVQPPKPRTVVKAKRYVSDEEPAAASQSVGTFRRDKN